MPTVIYVDVLLVLNFVVNFLLLRLTALCVGRAAQAGRLTFGALLGAAGSLCIFVTFPGRILWIGFRLLLAAAMVLAALPWEGPRRWALSVFCLMAVSFLFSGGMIALFLALRPSGMLVTHGVLYLDLSAAALLGACALCFVLTCLFEQLLRRRPPDALRCEVLVEGEGGASRFLALVDTGNSLVEPFSRKPVIVCEREAVTRALPMLASAGSNPENLPGPGVRYIFYRTVGSSGMLPAVLPPLLLIRAKNGEWRSAKGVYLAVTNQPLQADGCRAILNPEILERSFVNH